MEKPELDMYKKNGKEVINKVGVVGVGDLN